MRHHAAGERREREGWREPLMASDPARKRLCGSRLHPAWKAPCAAAAVPPQARRGVGSRYVALSLCHVVSPRAVFFWLKIPVCARENGKYVCYVSRPALSRTCPFRASR